MSLSLSRNVAFLTCPLISAGLDLDTPAMTTTTTVLEFGEADLLGRVAAVDTGRVSIDVSNSTLLTRIGIGSLIAIRGTTEQEYLIALTDRVTRSVGSDLPDASDGDTGQIISVPTDLLRGMLIGTFRIVEGSKRNTFKRGADSFPQIDRESYVVEGKNLQRFMGILGADHRSTLLGRQPKLNII